MRRLVPSLVLAGLLSMSFAAPAAAHTWRIPVSDTSNLVSTLDPGVTTFNGDVMSVRGLVQVSTRVSSSLFIAGSARGVINFDLNVVTGRGVLWGTETEQPSAYPNGAWHCAWVGRFVNGSPTNYGACLGAGSLRGYVWTAVITPSGVGSYTTVGYIYPPLH